MAKKTVKKTSKKTSAKKVVRKSAPTKAMKKVTRKKESTAFVKPVRSTPRKILIVKSNFVMFAILFALCFVLYYASSDLLYKNFFFLASLILGSLTAAFLLIFIILYFMKLMQK